MSLSLSNTETQYGRDGNLKKSDVQALIEWTTKQPHLPQITEFQALLFLHSCYYSNEAAKKTIDAFFTVKTIGKDLFGGRNPLETPLQVAMNTGLITPLPKKTPEGYTLVLIKLMDFKPENYNFPVQVKYLDMSLMLHLHQDGISDGHLCIFDMKGTVFGHMTRVGMAGPSVLKKLIFYLEEALPLRLKGIHFVNIVPFMDKILAMVRPLMNLQLLDLLHLHNTVDDLVKVVPRECLPQDYGGEVETSEILHEKHKSRILANAQFFQTEDGQRTDETKRLEKSLDFDTVFGIDGTFKKLEID